MNALRSATPGWRSASVQTTTGVNDLATPRQPERHVVVTYVLGTFCYPCLRVGQGIVGSGGALPTFPPTGLSRIFTVRSLKTCTKYCPNSPLGTEMGACIFTVA